MMHPEPILFAIGAILSLAVILGVVGRLFSFSSRSGSRSSDSLQEILERDLADGEIDTAEYARRLAALHKTKRAA
jgi:uncharacterized membrane protein